jgi:septal ring factor EnvC (AmiA/AmiB activator)
MTPDPESPGPWWEARINEIKHEVRVVLAVLAKEAREDRKQIERSASESRADIEKQLADLNASLSKLASARLLQQAFTALILAALFTLIYKALGG